jgi:citrate synthase
VKAKREKLFGFGHRVYKNFDPRAKIIRGVAEDVFKIAGRDPLIEIAIALQVRFVAFPMYELCACDRRVTSERVTSCKLHPGYISTASWTLHVIFIMCVLSMLQDAALSDEYFVSRKLYPNVDFYSGLVYRAMGFPPQFFTVLFAIPR